MSDLFPPRHLLEEAPQVFWKRGGDLDGLFKGLENNAAAVQCQSGKSPTLTPPTILPGISVLAVPQDGVRQPDKVASDLMGSAGLGPSLHETASGFGTGSEDAKPSLGFLHPSAVVFQGTVDREFLLPHLAADECQVGFLTGGQRIGQWGHVSRIQCDHQTAGGRSVQTVRQPDSSSELVPHQLDDGRFIGSMLAMDEDAGGFLDDQPLPSVV